MKNKLGYIKNIILYLHIIKNLKMNITTGQSAKKQHLSNGSLTACNRRTSFSQHDFQSFKWTVENFPSHCCQKCLNRFNEKQNKLNEKVSKLQNQLK